MKALTWKWIGGVIAPAIGILLVAVSAQANEASFETIALSGQPAGGAGPGANYLAFNVPFINSVGQVSFYASLDGPAVQPCVNDLGIWVGIPGDLVLVARRGDPAPDTAGDIYYDFRTPVLNDVGQFALRTMLNEPGGDNAYYFGTLGDFSLLLRQGDPAPGTPAGITFGHNLNSFPFLNNAGQLAFRAELAGDGVEPNNEYGVWAGAPGVLSLVARSGIQAPGTPAGVVFANGMAGSTFEQNISLNNSGHVAFKGKLEGPGVWAGNDTGIWAGPADALELAVREGNPAPGTGDYVTFEDLNDREFFNGAGEILFRSFLTGPGVNYTNNVGLWVGPPGAISLLVRKGEQAPDTPAGVLFGVPDRGPLDAAGQAAFICGLSGTGVDESNDSAIFFGTPGALSLIVREGDQVPDAAPGVVFGGFDLERVILNCSSQLVFMSDLTGPGVDETNDRAILAWDPREGLMLVARTGDSFEVAPGDMRTIDVLFHLTPLVSARGCDENAPTSFNDQGELAFFASFADESSGIFVATLLPELPGDLDGDGDVDLSDLAQLLAHYGMTGGAQYEDGDLDGDGDVDLSDLAALLAVYGTTCP